MKLHCLELFKNQLRTLSSTGDCWGWKPWLYTHAWRVLYHYSISSWDAVLQYFTFMYTTVFAFMYVGAPLTSDAHRRHWASDPLELEFK